MTLPGTLSNAINQSIDTSIHRAPEEVVQCLGAQQQEANAVLDRGEFNRASAAFRNIIVYGCHPRMRLGRAGAGKVEHTTALAWHQIQPKVPLLVTQAAHRVLA